jgi:signal transduction histidine kinase
MAATHHRVAVHDPQELIGRFISIDRLGAAIGFVFVVVANGLFVQVAAVWWTLPFLACVIVALTVADRYLERGRLARSLAAIAIGNWVVAIAIAALLPFLWPVMVLTAIMPLLLATPFLESRQLIVLTSTAAFVGGLVAIIGLLSDDSGVLPDIDDVYELVLVTGALVGHTVPMALIVRQQKQIQSSALEAAERLNDELRASEMALAASRRRIVEASDHERSRIERDLHDGAQQRMIAVRLRLDMLAGDVVDPEHAAQIEHLVGELGAALDELRELAHGIYPPVLETGGLAEAVAAVVRRSPSRIELDVRGVGRYDRSVETAVYFTVLEALSNVAKYASDASVGVALRDSVDDAGTRELVLEVVDDGPGFRDAEPASTRGLLNMNDRIRAVGGLLEVDSEPGHGVRLTARMPIGSVDG